MLRKLTSILVIIAIALTCMSLVDRGVNSGRLPENNITRACGDIVDIAGCIVVENYDSLHYVINNRGDAENVVASFAEPSIR